MEQQNRGGFVAYDYLDVSVDAEQAPLYRDAYENFGWEPDELAGPVPAQGKARLRFRRDRKILNKAELTRLQRNFDACMAEIQALESSKRSSPTAAAIAVGVVGTACMAGSVFAVTATPPIIPLCVGLAIPGFLGWIMPWFLYRKLVAVRVKKITPLIESKYDELYEVCEKGSKLL